MLQLKIEQLDFALIESNPKWIQGYSDISTLLFAITTKTGVATAHGSNFMDSIENQDDLTANSRSYLTLKSGESFKQASSTKWQEKFGSFEKNLELTFNLTEETKWKSLSREETIKVSGRLIGGCLDTLRNLVGTPYGDVPSFSNEFCPEGLILYLENSNSSPMEVLRTLHNMKYAGWFEKVNGVVFGRSNADGNESYVEVIRGFFDSSDFPVIYDADIGHKPPQMTLINGAYAELSVSKGNAELLQKLI